MKNSYLANTVNEQGKHSWEVFDNTQRGNTPKINQDKYANGKISKGHKEDIYKRRNFNIHMAANKHLRKHLFYPIIKERQTNINF